MVPINSPKASTRLFYQAGSLKTVPVIFIATIRHDAILLIQFTIKWMAASRWSGRVAELLKLIKPRCRRALHGRILALFNLQLDLFDMGVAPISPTIFFTDAQPCHDRRRHWCGRLKKPSCWMATYAMMRLGLACKTIRLMKVAAAENARSI